MAVSKALGKSIKISTVNYLLSIISLMLLSSAFENHIGRQGECYIYLGNSKVYCKSLSQKYLKRHEELKWVYNL